MYIWQLAVILVLVPTLCRAGGVGTRFCKINLAQGYPAQGPYVPFSYLCLKSGTRLQPPPLAQGCSPPVFHDVAQGPHKVSDDIFPIKGITASRHIEKY